VTKGSIGEVQNLHFTTVLSARDARSDERVVKSIGAITAPRQKKEYILTLFQRILISSLSLQRILISSLSLQNFGQSLMTISKDSHPFSRTLRSL